MTKCDIRMKKTLINTLASMFISAMALTSLASCDPIDNGEDGGTIDFDTTIRTDVLNEGYYKDIFMDSGVYLTSRTTLPAASYLGWTMDYYASAANEDLTAIDTLLQSQCFSGYETDLNGYLLYPDGAPRYKVIYVNGGKSTKHGDSLGESGLNAIRTFVNNGGTYVGTCAGAFMASNGYDGNADWPSYTRLWPGMAQHTGLSDSYTGMTIVSGSPLLDYYDFGGDMYIDEVRHNGGCFANSLPNGTEILALYDFPSDPSRKFQGKPSIWAYKITPQKGRMVMCGSHPEGVTGGERRDLFAAFLRYAVDGRGIATVKTTLKNGELWEMTKGTKDKDPKHTMIGDRQYHHFAVAIPSKAKKIKVTLNGDNNFDFNLYMTKETFAFENVAQYKQQGTGGQKELSFDTLEPGLYYIAVQCTSVPSATVGDHGVKYVAHTEILNGAPYTISVTWK